MDRGRGRQKIKVAMRTFHFLTPCCRGHFDRCVYYQQLDIHATTDLRAVFQGRAGRIASGGAGGEDLFRAVARLARCEGLLWS